MYSSSKWMNTDRNVETKFMEFSYISIFSKDPNDQSQTASKPPKRNLFFYFNPVKGKKNICQSYERSECEKIYDKVIKKEEKE